MGLEQIGKSISDVASKTNEAVKDTTKDIDKRIDVKNANYIDPNKSLEISKTKDIDSRIDISNKILDVGEVKDAKDENTQLGGSYKELQMSIKYDSKKHEIHHIPADSINELKQGDGPAIIMDKKDHRRTASCGSTNEAKAYRKKQADFINNGQFEKAVEMDIKDIKSKFGNKYDKQISEMKEYVKEIKKGGII